MGMYMPPLLSFSHLRIYSNLACNGCDETLREVRIICMDCNGNDTIDLCDRQDCSSAVIDLEKRKDLQRPHMPTHDIFKARTILHGRYHGMVERRAKATLAAARAMFVELNRNSLSGPKPACISCEKPASQPCWACVDCTGGCTSCRSVTMSSDALLQTGSSYATSAILQKSNSPPLTKHPTRSYAASHGSKI
jgi:hypothetical protein